MKKRMLTLISSLLIISVFLLSCSKEKKPEAIVRPVKAMQIGSPALANARIFPGVTLATNESKLAFQIPGQIVKFPVLEGDHVIIGATIAELDALKYQEKVNETSAKLTRDKGNYERGTVLVKKGHLSEADYDKVKSAYLISKANYNTALNDLNNTKLITPFAGVIAKKYVKNYEYITAKQPIVLLQDTDNIDIEINVPENVIMHLKSHQVDQKKMYAVFDALPNQNFKIKLKEYSSQADPQTQTFRIVFTMDRPKKFNILPGMSVSIHAPLGMAASETVYLIPSSAVFMDESNKPSVWLIDKNTMKVKRTTVTTSNLSTDQIRVLSGLKSGDLIVISGVHYLKEGQEIKMLK